MGNKIGHTHAYTIVEFNTSESGELYTYTVLHHKIDYHGQTIWGVHVISYF